ncbi:cAMP-dependent protein kinase catalytic subunit beta-like [Bacillus rossius redtenbacheri]|uniref:cAMP-dependent protein kinase catalytic subunit beta-like n=1 Tax=Bacillus rossius redtenbacheri TaxID=93214 RepID=UPI002FDE6007
MSRVLAVFIARLEIMSKRPRPTEPKGDGKGDSKGGGASRTAQRDKEAEEYQEYLEKAGAEFTKRFSTRPPFLASTRTLNFKKVIGRGSFGVVQLALSETSGEFVAVKMLDKSFLVRSGQVKHALNELKISYAMDFPFVLNTKQFHHDNSYLYFVMPFMAGGDMFSHIRRQQRFTEDVARFYAAQMTLTLEYMHFLKLVHRDVKPENILIDEEGYIKVMDFGFTKYVEGRAYTTVGTPEYMAPELFLNTGYNEGVDWWALGILIFEMCAGSTPFAHRNKARLHERIIAGKYDTPKTFSPGLDHLLRNLIQKDLTKRLGTLKNGAADIKNHRWFRAISWTDVFDRKVKPEFVPEIREPGDLSNFLPEKSDFEMNITEVDKYREYFKDF